MKAYKIWEKNIISRTDYYTFYYTTSKKLKYGIHVNLNKCGSIEKDCIFIDDDKLRQEGMNVFCKIRGSMESVPEMGFEYQVYIDEKFCLYINDDMSLCDYKRSMTYNEFIIKELLE